MIRYLTVQEAAELSGVSRATMRRWAADGKVPATKRGGVWLIRGDYEAAPERRHRTGIGTELEFDLALRHIQSVDLKELWVPDILRHEDLLTPSARTWLLDQAALRVEAPERIEPIDYVSHPKTPLLTRSSALLSLPDRVAYHAAVLPVLGQADPLIPAAVFSARPSPDPSYLLLKGRDQWLKWRDATLQIVVSGFTWMAKTDITSFFDFIQHRQLFADLQRLAIPDSSRTAVRRMLNIWERSPGVGIPQGPDASRVLGNFYLLEADQEMESGPWAYTRFLDDIRVLGRTQREVIEGMRVLQEVLSRRGTVLSSEKTTLLHGPEALQDLKDDRLDAIEYNLRAPGDSSSAQELRALLRDALETKRAIDIRAIRFSLWRLRELGDHYAIRTVMNSLESLGPVAQIVATYLQPHLHMPSVRAGLTDFLVDSSRNLSEFLSGWLLAALLDADAPYESELISYSRGIARDANQPKYHRNLAFSFVALGGETADIAWLRRSARRERDPSLIRGLLVALARAGQLDRETADVASARDEALRHTVKYLREQRSLPSLIFADKSQRRPIVVVSQS